jgi:enterochelin esterase-like enzyme
MRVALALFVSMFPALVEAQTPQPVVSPEVLSDSRVVFRLRAPNAREVAVAREGAERILMQKDDQGVWTLTTEPLDPDLYAYSFVVDGLTILDPVNPVTKPNILNMQSLLHVPGPSSVPWEIRDVPRGTLHRHFYRSAVVGDYRDFFVYTPPGYDPAAAGGYPVLYLLHGFSDDASGWTAVGRAHVILDNLIAGRKARPMLIVMPLGYGAPQVLTTRGPRDPALWLKNMEGFRDATLKEVLPQVERLYNVSKDRSRRAIAGLSMGGAESLFTGLNALDHFAWIGAFSSGGLGDNFEKTFPGLDGKANGQLRLLWVACGKDDRLIADNLKFLEWLKSRGVRYTWTETAGAHTWRVWRRYLADFVPLLFHQD